jgi:hypothetical protein
MKQTMKLKRATMMWWNKAVTGEDKITFGGKARRIRENAAEGEQGGCER